MSKEPTHPGTVFLKDILEPLGINISDAAEMLGVSIKELSDFVNEKSSLTPEMAIRIAKTTNTSPESWMLMQMKQSLLLAMKNEPINVKAGCLA